MELQKILDDIALSLNDAKETHSGNMSDSPYARLVSKLKTDKERSFYRRLAFAGRYCLGDKIESVTPSYLALANGITPSDRMFYECFYFHLVNRLLSDRELCKGIDDEVINDWVLPRIEQIIEKTAVSDSTMRGFPNNCRFADAIKEFVTAALMGVSNKNYFEITGLKDVKVQWLYEYMDYDKVFTLLRDDGSTRIFKEGALYAGSKTN